VRAPQKFGIKHHLRFPHRRVLGRANNDVAWTVSPAVFKKDLEAEASRRKTEKTEEERLFLARSLRCNRNLRSLVGLSEDLLQRLCDVARREAVAEGGEVTCRGEYGTSFYIIESGRFEMRLASSCSRQTTEEQGPRKSSSAEEIASEMRQRLVRKELFLRRLNATASPKHGAAAGAAGPLAGDDSLTPKSDAWTNSDESEAMRDREPSALERQKSRSYPTDPMVSCPIGRRGDFDEEEWRDGSSDEAEPPRRNSDLCLPAGHLDACPPEKPGRWSVGVPEEREVMMALEDDNVLFTRGPGESFGELSLMYNAPMSYTAVAAEDAVVWSVSQADFRRIMLRRQSEKIERIVACLDQVDVLQPLLSHEKHQLAGNFIVVHFKRGDWIVLEGEQLNVWYVIVQGECEMTNQADGHLGTLRPPRYFGERALLRGRPSEFSVQAVSEGSVRCLVLDGPTFKDVMHLLRSDPAFSHAMEDELGDFVRYKGAPPKGGLLEELHEMRMDTHTSVVTPKLDPRIHTRSLNRIGILGMGAFGAVTLEQDPKTGQMFALKTLSKGYIIEDKGQENVNRERQILSMLDSPFVVKLYATWKDSQYLYFLFEPLLGGELHQALHRVRSIRRQERTYKFIIACIVCALAHLHERHVVYRDLKPENILFSNNGYAKLCDMGFATFVLGKTMTICGTPEYIAPEIIDQEGYDRMVDWWALGVLTFELLSGGRTPFGETDDPDETMGIFMNMKAGIQEVEFPFRDTDPLAAQFVEELLRHLPTSRLGVGGSPEVMRHKFLADVNFEEMQSGRTVAPYIPRISSEQDLGNFDVADQTPPPFYHYEDDGTGWDAAF